MKKLIFAIIMMMPLMAMAQTSPQAKARVAEIRKMYAAAKEEISNSQKMANEGQPGNETVVNSNYMMPGTGQASVLHIIIIS